MKILNKGSIKKKFDKKIHKDEISKEAKEDTQRPTKQGSKRRHSLHER
jgi:hypothetical protein